MQSCNTDLIWHLESPWVWVWALDVQDDLFTGWRQVCWITGLHTQTVYYLLEMGYLIQHQHFFILQYPTTYWHTHQPSLYQSYMTTNYNPWLQNITTLFSCRYNLGKTDFCLIQHPTLTLYLSPVYMIPFYK